MAKCKNGVIEAAAWLALQGTSSKLDLASFMSYNADAESSAAAIEPGLNVTSAECFGMEMGSWLDLVTTKGGSFYAVNVETGLEDSRLVLAMVRAMAAAAAAAKGCSCVRASALNAAARLAFLLTRGPHLVRVLPSLFGITGDKRFRNAGRYHGPIADHYHRPLRHHCCKSLNHADKPSRTLHELRGCVFLEAAAPPLRIMRRRFLPRLPTVFGQGAKVWFVLI